MKNLEPRAVWELFDRITRIPRPSKKEERIVAWLVDFAIAHGLEWHKDVVGNVVIMGPASPGMEDRPTVVLQNHVDMVCESRNADGGLKNAQGEPFDFTRDPIETYVTPEGWVRARGTTLGADNGLGMAAALAVLIDPEAVHGPVEALFTVDEETGLTGAFNLAGDMITGKYLINLDSEDEGEVFIGCAGGVDTVARFDYTLEPVGSGYAFFELSVSGLTGGHSGDDIEKGRGNSNKILARVLWSASCTTDPFDLQVVSIDGGNLRNAIPREACAVVAVPEHRAVDFVGFVEGFAAEIVAESEYSDPGVRIVSRPVPPAPAVIGSGTVRRLLAALTGVPNGVLAMSGAMPGLVETSTNLASVKMVATATADKNATSGGLTGLNVRGERESGGEIVVVTSQRSSLESAKHAAAAAVEAVFVLAGARVEHSDGYPGWAPDPSSHLLEVARRAYIELFDRPVRVRAIHAGLECGLLLEKFPHLEMISTGPTILGAHSPDERLEVASVERFWRLLLAILKEL